MSGHEIVRCTCGRVVSQCRCPGPHPTRMVNGCGKCGLGVQADGGAGMAAKPLAQTMPAFDVGTFSVALVALKEGRRVQRAGWNGKGMFVFLMPGYPDGVPANEATARGLDCPAGYPVRVLPYLVMRTVDGAIVPWLISQTDALADDWTVLP